MSDSLVQEDIAAVFSCDCSLFPFSRFSFVLVEVPEEQGPAVAEELVARPGERAHSPPPPATPPGVELHGEMHCTSLEMPILTCCGMKELFLTSPWAYFCSTLLNIVA